MTVIQFFVHFGGFSGFIVSLNDLKRFYHDADKFFVMASVLSWLAICHGLRFVMTRQVFARL